MLWIYLAYPSGKKPKANVGKEEGETWKATGRTLCLSHSSRQIRFVAASLAFSCVRGVTLVTCQPVAVNKAKNSVAHRAKLPVPFLRYSFIVNILSL